MRVGPHQKNLNDFEGDFCQTAILTTITSGYINPEGFILIF